MSTSLGPTPDVERIAQLERALELSHRLVALAREGAWEQIEEVERARFGSLQAALSQPVRPEDADRVGALLRAMLALTADAAEAARAARRERAEKLAALSAWRRGVRAYQELALSVVPAE
jgi:hypothetical protein